ncbi:NAD(P)/FAD-dependent oxidoreductase [Robiginitalea marina]|uniref:FAD-binding oxidoreductase n=1 Tax=Robiginitalea marina TaxID=2954105 RepID=A0ABT1B1J8_9FLAO|nr:FAD-dependent oxidoreductase [Robiginitalea marina]MCO5725735.1 FAD-binding oxidoreductase [Robiginitalea marina]
MAEYLVVGAGLGGIALADTLLGQGHAVEVYDDGSQRASQVAGGLYNPVVLKRFTLSWEGRRLMRFSIPFYERLERELGVSLDEKLRVLRLLHSAREQNEWFEATDRPGLDGFLSTRLLDNQNPCLEAPFGFGEVLHTGRIHTETLLTAYRARLEGQGRLRTEAFDYKALEPGSDKPAYKGKRVDAVVFCEGFGLQANPFFNYLPLNGTKGELLVVHAPQLKENNVIKSGVFLIPMGEGRYLVGATYHNWDKDPNPTEKGREELLEKLRKFLKCGFTVESQRAGIRPTVADRRPLVGRHPLHQGLYVLNGLGSRGVLVAPYAAHCLQRLIDFGDPLPEAMDSARFARRFEKQAGQP